MAAANSKLNTHLGTVDVKGEQNIHPTWIDGIISRRFFTVFHPTET